MKSQDVVNDIKTALGQAKKQGHTTVSIEAFDNYLAQLEKDIVDDTYYKSLDHERKLALFKAENDRNIAHSNNQTSHAIEMFKSVIATGQTAIKGSMLINGGAAVALLAFTGKIWSSSTSADIANGLTSSIFLFCLGVLASAIAAGTAYLAQFSFASHWERTGNTINVLSILIVLASYLLFGYGAFSAAGSLGAHFGL